MENPSMDTIYQAISALYDISNSTEKEKASIWLGDIQKSIQSWKIADDLLQQRKTVYSCYFAAQTMRSKVQNSLLELSEESIVSLRDSLVAHLKATSPDTDTAPILTQLCLALADLALQMPSWQNCVNDLINLFSNNNDFALLEILTVLPQEIDSTHLKLGENRRADIKNELRANSSLVTLFLKESITNSQNTHVALKIVKCMTSWIQVDAIDLQEIPHNAVIGYCLQVLRDHNAINTVHDAASDCICSLLHCFEDNNNNDVIQKLLFDNIASLEESYHLAVAHEEEEKAANYARVFTVLAETFLEKIIACTASGNSHFGMRSLDLALVCVGHHDYEVAEITFNLWYRLSEDVYQRDYQPLTDAFKPHIERLIEALARHCQCEPDLTHLPDEGDEFFEFRMKVMGLIKDVVFIVGSSSVFRQMFASLQADMSWEQTEAALFVMQAVAKNIIPEEYEYVPKVVEAILSMPPMTHLAVRKTCILLLGELCEWIERHAECLEPCLATLIAALEHPHLAYAAAIALQNICRACGSGPGPGPESGPGTVARLLEAAQGPLAPAAAAALMRALAAAISALPPQQMSSALRSAAAGPLRALAGGAEPSAELDRLAALFRDVQPAPPDRHLCLPAMADAWPFIDDLLDKYSDNRRLCERACRCVRFMARCAGRALAPLASALCSRLAALYGACAHSCVLYLAGVLLDELYAEPAAAAALLALLQDALPRAFDLLHQPNGLRDNPDTVDDLFRLCIRFLQRIPGSFLSSGAAGAVLGCAAQAAELDHRDANSSVMKFIYDFLRLANTSRIEMQNLKELAEKELQQHAEPLAFGVVSAAALHLHPYMLDEVGEALLQLAQWARARRPDLLRAALAELQLRARTKPTDHQCAQFHHAVISAEKSKEMTRLLRDFAKLYR